MTFGLAIPLCAAIAVKIDPSKSLLAVMVFVLVCSVVIGLFATGIGLVASSVAGAFGRFTMGGGSTPYKEQYSQEQALVMRG